MNTNLVEIAYYIYLPVSIILTFYVASTLFKNSKVYMRDIFNNREEIAISTNTLFKIGFYLLNIGFALFILPIDEMLKTNQRLIEVLSFKVGGFSIYLGFMLFFNIYMFFRGKKVAKQKRIHSQLAEIITK
ncbi:MAG TPA: hypothetical protein VKT28_20155 [Puia sp.]|nr:hypothetical protein [Puia sp.]